jgi:hypothetical protein
MGVSSVDSIEVALIELQYALGDYYGCREQDDDVVFDTLDPSLRELRKIAFSVQRAIGHVNAKPKIAGTRNKETAFLHAVGR